LNKTLIIQQLRSVLPLQSLLQVLDLKPSSYHYCVGVVNRPDKHADLRALIRDIARGSGNTYGSPRIWLALRRQGVRVSEKVVRRIMREEQIQVFYAKRKRRYSSYEGEKTPAPSDKVRRRF